MDYYIKLEETKREKMSNGKTTILIRCGCKLCDKCWFSPLRGECIYGGPYSGYEEESDGPV